MDWGVGQYEVTADELMPFSRAVVAEAALQPGEKVLDVGCGTGNAAAVAAQAGADVAGVDPSPRLVEVARERVPDGEFVVAGAEALPFDDATFDCAFSIFALIFAPDPEQGMDEIVRVLKPGGRAFVTSWVRTGPIDAGVGTFVRAATALSGDSPRGRFPWGDADEVRALVERHGGRPDVRVETHRYVVPSAQAWVDRFVERHPMGIPMAQALERAGRLDEVRAEAVQRLHDGGDEVDGGLELETSALVTRITR
jgi:SAM-dependent methyltransferase